MRCRKYAAAKEYWRRRNSEVSYSGSEMKKLFSAALQLWQTGFRLNKDLLSRGSSFRLIIDSGNPQVFISAGWQHSHSTSICSSLLTVSLRIFFLSELFLFSSKIVVMVILVYLSSSSNHCQHLFIVFEREQKKEAFCYFFLKILSLLTTQKMDSSKVTWI